MSDRTAQPNIRWKDYAFAARIVLVGGVIVGATDVIIIIVLEPIVRGSPKHRIPNVIGLVVSFTVAIVIGFLVGRRFSSWGGGMLLASVICAALESLIGVGIVSFFAPPHWIWFAAASSVIVFGCLGLVGGFIAFLIHREDKAKRRNVPVSKEMSDQNS